MTPLLTMETLRWSRADFVLEVDALALYPGRLYVLRGANGAGKSSLLRLLALLQAPERGRLCLAGEAVEQCNRLRLRRQVTLVEQEPLLLRGTVADNLAYGLKLRGVHGAALREQIAVVLAEIDLSGMAARPARELSGGEQRRVALARALIVQPRLLLLDEPTSGLDREERPAFESRLRTLAAAGTTVVVASHEARQAERLGAETIRLARGRILPG